MKIKLLVDCEGPNPEFNRRKPIGPNNPRDRLVPAGTEIEHPDAWQLCLPHGDEEEIRAEPADDEAKVAVEQALARRDQILARRKRANRTATAAAGTPRRRR